MATLPDHALPDGFQWRLLSPDDVQPILALRALVLASLPLADLYVRESDELAFIARHLGLEGETLGVFDGTTLVAYAMLGLPAATAPDNLARWLPVSAPDLARSATIASCMVHPHYRGQGLQRRLLQARFARAQAHQRVLCVGAVSLHNHVSRHNLMDMGMHVAWVGLLTGLRRQLMAIHLTQAWTFSSAPGETVHALDFERQCQLISQDHFGVSGHTSNGNIAIVFKAIAA